MKHHRLQETSLRYFLEVARSGSISEASTRLNVASSAISRQISSLEKMLGTPLFERRSRGMVVSAAGEMLATYAFRNALEASRLVQDIDALQGLRRGVVHIATSEGFAIEFLPKAIADFRQTYPAIDFQVAVCASADVTRRVREGVADIGLTFSRTGQPDIKVEHRQSSPVRAIMRPDHPLTRTGSVSLSQISAYPVVLPDTSTTIRQLFDLVTSQQRLAIKPALVSNHIVTLLSYVTVSDAITIAGEVTVDLRRRRGEFAVLPIRDRGLDSRSLEVQTLVGRTLPKVVQVALDFLLQRLALVELEHHAHDLAQTAATAP